MDPFDTVTRQAKLSRLPVRNVRVEVMRGLDQGKSHGGETVSIGTAPGNDLVLTDPTVSRFHVELSRGADGIHIVDHGSTNGSIVGSVAVKQGVVQPGATIELGHTTVRVSDAVDAVVELSDVEGLAGVRGSTPLMRRLVAQLQKAASSDVPLLLSGESGTGKELIASAVHTLGPNAAGPFVIVDCGALTPTLVASELFGHERGAFTGAVTQHIGAFERAAGGTLLLDEIGELPPALQATLLGVLERRKFTRVGGRQDIAFNARVLSATHHDLRDDVNAGTFRLDLYYRLAVVTLKVAALRERADDIPLLVEHFLRTAGHDGPVRDVFDDEQMKTLVAYRWPGNVRELRNVVEATLAMGELGPLQQTATPVDGDVFADLMGLPYKDARTRLLDGFEKRYLDHLLAETNGNVSEASRKARMDRSYLRDLIKRHRPR